MTEKDLFEAQTRHAGMLGRILRIFYGFLIIAMVGGMFLSHAQISVLPIPFFIVLALFFRLRLTTKLEYRRDFAGQPETEAVVSDSGVVFSNAKGNSNLSWSAFARFAETKNLFMLYPQSNLYNIISKRGMAPEEVAGLRDTLQRNLGPRMAAQKPKLSPAAIVLIAVTLRSSCCLPSS